MLLNVAQLVLGIVILVWVVYDFFYTTLSFSGAGSITKKSSIYLHLLIQKLLKYTGRKIYMYSGMLINLLIFVVWFGLIWGGLYFILSYDPAAITNDAGKVANNVERFYFSGYILSTLGMGNFYPTSHFFEILSSLFSVFGFIFFTTSITYFLSVSGAVINKRTLSKSINVLGQNPREIADKLSGSEAYQIQMATKFTELLNKHIINHQAFPIVHYYNHPSSTVCLGINIARLDEALNIILSSPHLEEKNKAILDLRVAITSFIRHLEENYPRTIAKIEGSFTSKRFSYDVEGMNSKKLVERRQLLVGILKSEGFEWKDISPEKSSEGSTINNLQAKTN